MLIHCILCRRSWEWLPVGSGLAFPRFGCQRLHPLPFLRYKLYFDVTDNNFEASVAFRWLQKEYYEVINGLECSMLFWRAVTWWSVPKMWEFGCSRVKSCLAFWFEVLFEASVNLSSVNNGLWVNWRRSSSEFWRSMSHWLNSVVKLLQICSNLDVLEWRFLKRSSPSLTFLDFLWTSAVLWLLYGLQ